MPKEKEQTKTKERALTVRFEESVYEEMERIAKADNRSISYIARIAFKEYVERQSA